MIRTLERLKHALRMVLIKKNIDNMLQLKLRNTGSLVLVIFCLLCTAAVNAIVPKNETKVLLELYNGTQGQNWNTTWDVNAPVNTWYGVTVQNGHVVEINLFRNNLVGSLPKSLGELKHLVHLNLAFNTISGEIPKSIAELSKLEVLKLEMNRLEGEIPSEIGNMKSLEKLSAFNNFLSGRIPESLGNIQTLKELNLSSNNLTGRIPNSLGGLSKLETLGLFENKLYGSIPGELGKLDKLKELVLANNELGGEIPKEFGQLSSLKVLQIQNNNIFSFENMDSMNSGQFLVFDYDKKVEEENKYKDFDVIKTRMADTKFEDEMEE